MSWKSMSCSRSGAVFTRPELKANSTISSSSEQSTSCLLCLHLLLLNKDSHHQMGVKGSVIYRLISIFDIDLLFFIWMSHLRSIDSFSRGQKYSWKALKNINANFFLHWSSVWCIMNTLWCLFTPEAWATSILQGQRQWLRRRFDSLWIQERRGRSQWRRRSRLRCHRCRPRCSPRRGILPDTSRCSTDPPIRLHRCTLLTEGGSWEMDGDRKSVGRSSMPFFFLSFFSFWRIGMEWCSTSRKPLGAVLKNVLLMGTAVQWVQLPVSKRKAIKKVPKKTLHSIVLVIEVAKVGHC